MDTHQIPIQRLKNIIIIFFLSLALVSFLLHIFTPQAHPVKLMKNFLKKGKNLPLITMVTKWANAEVKNNSFTGTVLVPKGVNDFVLAGPYEPFFPGQYELSFNITPQCSDQVIGQMDAVSRFSKSFYETDDILAKKEGETQTVTMPFEGDFSWNYEFRVKSNGACSFEINSGKVVRKSFSWRLLGESIKMKLRSK